MVNQRIYIRHAKDIPKELLKPKRKRVKRPKADKWVKIQQQIDELKGRGYEKT